MVLRWVSGKNMRREVPKPKIMSLAGSYVARLHRYAEQYEIPQGATLPRWDWEWPFGESAPLWSKGEAFYSSGEMDAFRAAAWRVGEELEKVGKHSGAFGMIHCDLTLSNLLFKRNAVGAIDFDRCGLGYYLYDLARVRTSLAQHHEGSLELLWAAFIEGYERERPLPEDYQRNLASFDIMRRVAAVNTQLVFLGSSNTGARSRDPQLLSCVVCVARWLEERRKEG
jgi:Ser/Thr protein kinase RdoA (MazF antagonist)